MSRAPHLLCFVHWQNSLLRILTSPLQATDLIIILFWMWNIISFFEHFAPSLHLSLRVMPWQTFHPRGAAGFIVDENFIERRIPTPYQLRRASGYIYLVHCLVARRSGFPTHSLTSARSLVESGQLGTWLTSTSFQTTRMSQYPPTFGATSSGLGTLSLSSSHLRPLWANTGRIITLTATPRLSLPAIHHCIFEMPPTNPVLPKLEVNFFKESSLLSVDSF